MPTILYEPREWWEKNFSEPFQEPLYDPKATRWLLWENGATTDGHHEHHMPPTDPQECLRLRLRHAELLYQRAEADYQKSSGAYYQQYQFAMAGPYAGPPDDSWLLEIRQLREQLQAAKKKFDALKSQYKADPVETDKAWDKYMAGRADARKRAGEQLQKLRQLEASIPIS